MEAFAQGTRDNPLVVVPPPPTPELHLLNQYPVLVAILGLLFSVAVLLGFAKYVDPTGGPLTVSLALIITFSGAVIYALRFTIPQDAETGTLIGTLVLAIGTVVAYWLGQSHRE